MTDDLLAGDLPTPAQMQNFRRAEDAARQARRMGDASRAVVTGNVAFGACLGGVDLSLIHSEALGENGPFILCGLVYGYFVAAFLSLRWMKRRLANSPVSVVTRQEEAGRLADGRGSRRTVLAISFVLMGLATLGWSYAFARMSNGAILAVLSGTPLLGALWFVLRYARFHFGEDLLFAACVVAAYAPFLLMIRSELVLLSLVPLPFVVAGAASLHARWTAWSGAASAADADGTLVEGRS